MTSRLLVSLVLVFGMTPVALAQNSPSTPSLPIPERQEAKDRDRERSDKPAHLQAIRKAIERLKQAVNGLSAVANQCIVQGHEIEVEESSEIVEASSCDITLTTVKKSRPGAVDLRFTLRANLADLTTPASVEPLNLANCKPKHGQVFQVISRTQPGKIVRTTRTSQASGSTQHPVAESPTTPRKNVIFFFPDMELAKKGAHALDRAVALCGGEEWPDEDDLP